MHNFNLVLTLAIAPWLGLGVATAAAVETDDVDGVTATFKVLHHGDSVTGSTYRSGLIVGSDGKLYGTASEGGALRGGTAFRMSLDGDVTVLHAFDLITYNPNGLVQAPNGDYYGTTYLGGDFNDGTAFRMTPQGEFTVLHSFQAAIEGRWPKSLTLGRNGDFYGTTGYNAGVIFRMTASGEVTVIHSFGNSEEGWRPNP